MTREHDHLAMLKSPDEWPQWPILPVKKWEGIGMRCGIVLAVEGYLSTIFLTNLFALTGNLKDLIDNAEIERIVYDSPEVLVADGWEVD